MNDYFYCEIGKIFIKYQNDKKYWIEKYQTIPEVAVIPGSKDEDISTNDFKARNLKKERSPVHAFLA